MRGYRKLIVTLAGQAFMVLAGAVLPVELARIAIPAIAALAGAYVGFEGAADIKGRGAPRPPFSGTTVLYFALLLGTALAELV